LGSVRVLKGQGAIHVAPERLAQAEVTLVWAAVEYCELGWRHAREHFQAAERTIFQVQQQLPYVVMIPLMRLTYLRWCN
jgi:hypothetical protein